jgi:small-conductance mechanosensitive channel
MSWTKIIGKAIFYAALQAAYGSVVMSSSFSVKNFAKDQVTLQHAADALREYLFLAAIWTLATVLVLSADYGLKGGIAGFIANMIFIVWIYYTYNSAFKYASKTYNLEMPEVF